MSMFSAYDISALGLEIEMQRMQTIAANIANVNTTRNENGYLYTPKTLVSNLQFDQLIQGEMNTHTLSSAVNLIDKDIPTKLVYEPKHPRADANGYVEYPNVNTADEMLSMLKTVRVYEANIRAMNVAKAMAQRAIEIGSKR
ncbi:MAG: flagellar basal body rod protein FlgC [Gammaproteobacteria bacterium]|nr:flagellar basal body rod protein FlgC [Gammaproteobacteria bacterium]MDH5728910.1 flagellar basal body rod protein FlgC [Gammaproteobacteria bacterium]